MAPQIDEKNKLILLKQIDTDKDALVDFLSGFVRAQSPNPPGDTREAVDYITQFLRARNLPYNIIGPDPLGPNVVARFVCDKPGRNLALNGHIDVLPVEDEKLWARDPWSGEVADGRVWGRGTIDMKAGMASLVIAYSYLHRMRDQLRGSLTLTCVSDEETAGPGGARYLIDNCPEVLGDACLSGEPSGPDVIRFAERGVLWLRFKIAGRGAHGAYAHVGESAVGTAFDFVGELRQLEGLAPSPPENIRRALLAGAAASDRSMGAGASEIIPKVTMHVGLIRGGVKVNLIASACEMEVDIRLPVGLSCGEMLESVKGILAGYPQISMEVMAASEPNWCDPEGELAEILCRNVKELTNKEAFPIVKLGSTDTRLWRLRNVPAYGYGPTIINMGGVDESIDVQEFLQTVKVHTLSAYDYLVSGR